MNHSRAFLYVFFIYIYPAAALAGAPAQGCLKPVSCPAAGAAAPQFTLPLSTGDRLSLRELLERKKPVLVSFWQYNCAPCVAEFPELQKLADGWGDKVSILLIHVGGPEEKMRARLEEWQVKLPAGLDEYECTGLRYCIDSFPQLFVLDSKGTIRAVIKGAQKDFAGTVRAAVAPLLK